MRYFIIFYIIVSGEETGGGNYRYTSEKYPNSKTIRQDIAESCKYTHLDKSNYVITNIIELSKEDYEEFIA